MVKNSFFYAVKKRSFFICVHLCESVVNFKSEAFPVVPRLHRRTTVGEPVELVIELSAHFLPQRTQGFSQRVF